MAERLRFIVGYDGRPFSGWQSQAGGNTVQDHLERSFSNITRVALRVHGAGRTDTGVHALAQCAHADVPDRRLSGEQWIGALNATLPPTIRVLRCRYAAATFHARFSARGKVYRYRIWNDRVLPPLEHGRAWHVPFPLDTETLAHAAEQFLGRHDFRSFAANRGKTIDDTVRTIDSIRLRQRGRALELEIAGDGFLYKMVRLMAGTLVLCGRGQSSASEIRRRLREPRVLAANARTVAPAEGLYLIRVRY